MKGISIHQFRSRYLALAQRTDRPTGLYQVGEIDQGRCLQRLIGYGLEGHRRDKAQCSLGSNQQVHQDVHGILEIEKGIHGIATGVLQLIFLLDTCPHRFVGQNLLAQCHQLLTKRSMALLERLSAIC